jgi:hypothetical protein
VKGIEQFKGNRYALTSEPMAVGDMYYFQTTSGALPMNGNTSANMRMASIPCQLSTVCLPVDDAAIEYPEIYDNYVEMHVETSGPIYIGMSAKDDLTFHRFIGVPVNDLYKSQVETMKVVTIVP